MNRLMSGDVANFAVRMAVRWLALMRGFVRTASRHADDRNAARQAKRNATCSEVKLTDEMERKMIQQLMRNRGFRL